MDHSKDALEAAAERIRTYVLEQLVAAEVDGVAGLWGGGIDESAPPPK
jgi:hypothetical protein